MRLVQFLAISLCVVPSAVMSMSWDAAIEAVEAKSKRYFDIAQSMNAGFLGTAFNEIGVPRHRCSILGRMLKMQKFSAHLDVPEYEKPVTGQQFLEESQSLENWAYHARKLKELPKSRKIRVWNSECAGRMGIPVSVRIEEAVSQAFYDVRNGSLHVFGPVTKGYHSRLVKALNSHPKIKEIALGSDGGNVREALLAGAEIRKRGLNTTLWNPCYSACPLVFLGGVERTIWSPYPELGFHKISDGNGNPVPLASDVYQVVYQYVRAMGADPDLTLAFMLSAEPSDMHSPKLMDLCRANVADWIQRACHADEYR